MGFLRALNADVVNALEIANDLEMSMNACGTCKQGRVKSALDHKG